MTNALQDPEGRLRKKAGKDLPEGSLMFDLIAIAHGYDDGKLYGIEPGREVLQRDSPSSRSMTPRQVRNEPPQ